MERGGRCLRPALLKSAQTEAPSQTKGEYEAMKVGLISCAKRKGPLPSPAEDLHTSQLFQKAKAFVGGTCDRWFILSAKHGLLRPDEVIEPYDQTLNTVSKAERQAWAARILVQLHPLVKPGDRFVILAGARYQEYLTPGLKEEGYLVEDPLTGLRSGARLRWLKMHRP